MAKAIVGAELVVKHNASPSSYVRCTAEMPIAEFAAFYGLAGLTDSLPAAVKAYLVARNAAGTSSGG